MDELIYNLFLRSRGGLTLFGQLRYRLTGIEVGAAPQATIFALPQAQQQQQTVVTVVLRAEGSVTLPLLTGMQPVPVGDVAFFIQMGPPLLTRMVSADSRILIAFNQINNEQIGGHLVWGPTRTTFGLLGRRVILPA